MDGDTTVTEVQHSERELSTLHNLKRIITTEWPPERIDWLWEHLKDQLYAFDDTTQGDPKAFLALLFDPRTLVFELGDSGLIVARGISEKMDAHIHFAIWDKEYDRKKLPKVLGDLFSFLFTAFELNRLTAPVPRINQPAARLAVRLGFRFEGTLRKSYLKEGRYHDMDLYGILREEFEKCRLQAH